MTHELFPPEVWKMGEKVMYIIAKKLAEEGFDIKVLTTGNPKIKEIDGIKTIRIPINRYLMNLAFLSVYKHAKDCDIIQTSNYNACYPSFVVGKIIKKPVICLVQGAYGKRWFKMRGAILGGLSMFVEKFQINHDYDKLIFLSDYARDSALDIGVKKKLTQVIKPGIEFEKYKVGKKESFVLFVGRLAKQKGLESLLNVARELPEVKFLIVGTGEQEESLKSMATKNVHFLGFVPEKKLIDLYSRALIFCLPSVAETFGFVLLEAMASGCAIVSTVPLDYEGFRVDVEKKDSLKKAIKNLIDNPKVARKMGKINRKKAKKYRWDDFIKNLIKIYDDVSNFYSLTE